MDVGEKPYGTGHVGGAQFTTISGQVNLGHAPPTVSYKKEKFSGQSS